MKKLSSLLVFLCALCALCGEPARAQSNTPFQPAPLRTDRRVPVWVAWDFALGEPWCLPGVPPPCVRAFSIPGAQGLELAGIAKTGALKFDGYVAGPCTPQSEAANPSNGLRRCTILGQWTRRYFRSNWKISAVVSTAAGDTERTIVAGEERHPLGPRVRVEADPQGAPTQIHIEFDVSVDPLCVSPAATDCIAQAALVRNGVDVRLLVFSSFTVSGGIASATIAISSLPVGYGASPLPFEAVLDARAIDGSLVRGGASPFTLDGRRPQAPVVRKT